MSEPESGSEEFMDAETVVESSGPVEEDPARDTDRTDPLADLERGVQRKARMFVMVCTLCVVVALILLMLSIFPFGS